MAVERKFMYVCNQVEVESKIKHYIGISSWYFQCPFNTCNRKNFENNVKPVLAAGFVHKSFTKC